MDHSAPSVPRRSCAAYDLHGPEEPISPVILSVPHAGRDYDESLLAQARVRPEILQRLEDRWADLLAHPVMDGGHSVLVARAPRAMIDLNRHEREVDPGMVTGLPRDVALHSSAKLRGGLGLIPRRLPGAHELWLRPLGWTEVQRRIETVHRPYHAELARLMRAARDLYGHAILIDLHSMPPLPPPAAGQAPPDLVLGDRFGRSASARLMMLAADVAASHGVTAALNHPYAGGHMIERHGHPDHGLYAMQLEFDRSLYLDAAMEQPGEGLDRIRRVVSSIVGALAEELPRSGYALAAE
ncbi:MULTISPECIES: N-formylglutamate amidohydrolase [Sphingobium]|uniref:N-formylglutamate amidohydrolase n=1 Tax=Sphingobium chungbukense TaxID=56193 RepID=A0A0M3AVX4_9SPHN|nr:MULTISPECIES: N-formylglutamate amidohydrolase [Sphingobium]KKW94068.1 N-formylglutamate amidohydrolase [Sphingobium chungbukense]PJG47768.1 N-formylglutamate amidohydrolase [Sphingobium sp. LB126]